MAPTNYPTVMSRAEKAAGILSIPTADMLDLVKELFGVEDNDFGVQLLDADTTEEEYICQVLGGQLLSGDKKNSELKIKAAAAFLKGRDPFAKKEEGIQEGMAKVSSTSEGQALAGLLKSMRTVDSMSDRELLEEFSKDPDHKTEQELNKRSGGQFFVVLKEGTEGKDCQIDINSSLSLLKKTRKMVVPSMIPHPEDPNKIIEIYRITQLNPEDSIVELCPFCDEIMYKGYCPKCNANFAGVGDEERAYVRLASEKETFDVKSASDRRAILVDAMKGLEELRKNWPGSSIRFRELKALGDLPKLRKKRTLPSVKMADPFNLKSADKSLYA